MKKKIFIFVSGLFFLLITESFIHAADITLSWDPPETGGPVGGYMVYWSTVSGSFSDFNGMNAESRTSVTLSWLDVTKKYYFIVRAYNAAGMSSDSDEVYSTAIPTVTGTTPTNDTTPTWTWSGIEEGTGSFRYKLDSNDLSSGATATTELNFTPASALSEGSHTLYVQESCDDGDWSNSGSFTIVIDITAPVLTDISYSNTDSGITINGTSETGAVLYFYVNGSVYDQTQLAESSWSVSYSAEGNLTAGDTFEVIAVDAAGNQSVPFEYTYDPDDSSSSSKSSGGGGGCFIATAAYGSPFESHVKILREFRDSCLMRTGLGRGFVNLYYKYSPAVADVIAEHDSLKVMTRWGLAPVVGMAWVGLNTSTWEKATISMGFVMLIMGCWFFVRRRGQRSVVRGQ